jgi:gamma-glutamylcyclotransferase (GGCT)/AIG2-like uncharacterized protein YtfP
MGLEERETENLFSYGTLQSEEVQLATFGRRMECKPDALVGYSLETVRIEDKDFAVASGTEHHRNVQFTGVASDIVEGAVFALTEVELELADAYEPTGYKRVLAQLRSGMEAWVYVNARQ